MNATALLQIIIHNMSSMLAVIHNIYELLVFFGKGSILISMTDMPLNFSKILKNCFLVITFNICHSDVFLNIKQHRIMLLISNKYAIFFQRNCLNIY